MGYLGNCCCGCLIHQDSFTRDDGTPLRGRWCDDPDDYFIDDNEARCAVPDTLAILNVPHPDSVGSMSVSLKTVDEIVRDGNSAPGQKYRILVNLEPDINGDPAVCTSDNYYFAEYERLGASNAAADKSWLRLGVVANGIETILKSRQILPETGLTRTFSATIDDDTFCASVTGTILGQITAPSQGLDPDGLYCGFALSEADMKIDDFVFQKHYNSNPPETRELLCPNCGLCTCDIDDEPVDLPARLYLCVTTDPSPCDRLINLVDCCIEIEYDDLDGTWQHDDFLCCAGFNFVFGCDAEYGLDKYSLANTGGCKPPLEPASRSPSSASCEDGSATFTFGPYCITGGDLACSCRDVVDITDPPCCYYVTVSTEPCCE